MKTTGVIRKLDELGRITLPIELRRSLDLDVKDALEITVEDDCIILKKAENADIFTGGTEDLIEYEGKKVSKASSLLCGSLIFTCSPINQTSSGQKSRINLLRRKVQKYGNV